MIPEDFEDLGPLTWREKRYKIGGEEFLAKEANEAVAIDYRDRMASCISMKGKSSQVKGLGFIQIFLLSRVLYRVSNMTTVSIDELKSWPSRIVRKVYDDVRAMSGLEEEENEDEKQDEETNTDSGEATSTAKNSQSE